MTLVTLPGHVICDRSLVTGHVAGIPPITWHHFLGCLCLSLDVKPNIGRDMVGGEIIFILSKIITYYMIFLYPLLRALLRALLSSLPDIV